MQVLCQVDAQGAPAASKANHAAAYLARAEAGEATRRYARTLVDCAWEKREHFRERLQTSRSAWDVERMAVVDRNVIRVALAELTSGKVPPKVVLNEAIEIAREYASAESAGFVNGVLDEMYKSMRQRTDEGTEPQP